MCLRVRSGVLFRNLSAGDIDFSATGVNFLHAGDRRELRWLRRQDIRDAYRGEISSCMRPEMRNASGYLRCARLLVRVLSSIGYRRYPLRRRRRHLDIANQNKVYIRDGAQYL